ncbi:MAG: AAA family ATPase [Bacteroidetes bacterium]|nr:AAA family ATPase [Bacteroidota bacterium]
MAKEIGIELCRKETITKEDILSVVKKGMKLKSSTDYAIYTVENIANTNISLKLETGTTQSPTYDKIMAAYQQKKWDGGTTGGDAYEAAIAKYVYLNLLPSENYKLIQFHPAYSYEDFVRGITAKSNGTQVEYETVNKALALFAQKAVDNSSTNFVLIIDEINRANLPSVLGELIYALEYRGEKVDSMYDIEGDNSLVLPPNLYIIGTMNTADRSVGHIDYAIKRRFAFVDVPPSDIAIDEVITDADLNRKAKALYANVSKLFNEEKTVDKPTYLQSDFKAKDVQLGHSYFLANTHSELKMKLEFEIKPILFEYVKDGVLSPEAEKEIKALKVNE